MFRLDTLAHVMLRVAKRYPQLDALVRHCLVRRYVQPTLLLPYVNLTPDVGLTMAIGRGPQQQ